MILIVDDDSSVAASLALVLKQAGYGSQAAASPEQALEKLRSRPYDLVLQDMNFSRQTSGDEGLQLLGEIRRDWPQMPVILITAWGSIGLAVRGIQAGAADFITKPWTNPQLLQSVRTALGLAESCRVSVTGTPGREQLDATHDFRDLIGSDPKFVKVLQVVGRVSGTDASVLITGESGTGKEMIAEAVHLNSRRKEGPFVKVNVGGISGSLFESEMFGHVKGAFTDAHQSRRGRFELAEGGTIFLDEIGELDGASQVKMLRVLQDRTYEVLGSSQTRTADVRVISATNRNLAEMVSRGEFREDLLYRLNLIAVHLPALRERPGDIPILAEFFLKSIGKVYRRSNLSMEENALLWLRGLPWPGNVRQLKQLMERTVLLSEKDHLGVEDFRATLEMENVDSSRDALPSVGSMTMEELEKAMILKCLKYHSRNITKVAESLGMSRASLYRRFEKYGIDV